MDKLEQGFYGRMLKLALPIALQNLLTSCAGLVDTAMVVGLGNVATAAIGVAGRWTFLINIVLFGFCSGSSALISQFWGAKDKGSIHRTFGVAMLCAAGMALLYNLVAALFPMQLMRVFTSDQALITAGASYLRVVCFNTLFLSFNMLAGAALRSTEDVMTPLITSGIGVATNTSLNYILIYGKLGVAPMGLRGAAIATLLSTALQTVLILIIAIKKRGIIIAPIRSILGFDLSFVKRYFRVAMPVLCNEALWAVGTNIYVMVLARQGAENYAGYTMYSSIQELAFVFFVGICHACAIMVGKTVGEGRPDRAYHMAKRFVVMTPLMAVVVGLGLILVRNPILSLLPIETEYARQVASGLLLIYALWLPVRMISYTCVVGVFRAGGDTKIGFYYDMLTVFGMGIPVVALLGLVVKVPFLLLVLAMFVAEDTVKTYLCVRRFRSRVWIKQLTLPGDNAYDEQELPT